MRASVSRPEVTTLFASVCLSTILSLHSFVRVAEVLMLATPQSSANPPYLPSVPSSNLSTEATATAPAALQASVLWRTVENYTNQPTHFYSTQQTSKHQCGDWFKESNFSIYLVEHKWTRTSQK
ncbi:hypothetical protein PsorP6_002593 [Peronosclerospora sorghi]|uniref:Uncharacterized protein n=1 Tax=Peronosclerospora sorghi TaxID=230839 RepID=A0ACC0WTJ2_9STRA|nr:hypothetical protein PsorP6_002593 [Peronosclerospora sorghi]